MQSIGPLGFGAKFGQPTVHKESCIAVAPSASRAPALHREPQADTVQFGSFWNRKPKPEALMLKAVAANNIQEVKQYLDQGVSIEYQDKYGQTALSTAAWAGHADMVQFLLDRGANADRKSYNGTLLMSLLATTAPGARPWYPKVANILAAATQDINYRDDRGWTAINLAVKNGFDDVVDALIAQGADVTLADTDGKMTPLMWAAWRGKDELVMKILSAVPAAQRLEYIDRKSKYNRSALRMALDNNRKGVVGILRAFGATEPPHSGYDEADDEADEKKPE